MDKSEKLVGKLVQKIYYRGSTLIVLGEDIFWSNINNKNNIDDTMQIRILEKGEKIIVNQ